MNKDLLRAKSKRVLRKLNSRQGWAILVTTVFIMIIATSASIAPALRTTAHLQNVALDIAITRSENMMMATSSPIRHKIVKAVYPRIQQQLIDHLRKAQSGQPYVCQGVLTPPSSIGSTGNLENQFGLCEPEKLFDGLNGATNKTIDYLSEAYPEHNTPLRDPSLEEVRQSIVHQTENSYEYTLRTTYIGQETMPRGRFGNQREEKYQWSVRADVAMHTNDDITRGLVIYYDVTLTNNFYANGINGSGNACGFDETNIVPCPDDLNNPSISRFGSECVLLLAQDNATGAVGVLGSAASNGFPDNLPPGLRIINFCQGNSFTTLECPAENDQTLRLVRLNSTRPQIGCASANTGRQGISGLDPAGYVFSLTARITHIGSTYN
ncbi:MAG: hypothetical protein WAQ98_16905 [Blastocatellia bacterium]